ncbi:MAG: hypothetical protein JNK94_00405 [Hyphomonadaceae bacterium]|nr:hypothetical protein [Hyphomonadaceae bacterium]MBX3510796.1 hypothetical protein [Hyphomonadaceae bacterium]
MSVLACRALVRGGPLDMPTVSRKAHRAPTPTSGGVGIALGFAAGLLGLALVSGAWRHQITADAAQALSTGAAFAYGFLVLGFIDDANPLGPRLKFAIFTSLSFFAALALGVVLALPFGDGAVLKLGWQVGLIGTALWLFTITNAVNFMDGANGLSMGSVAVGLVALAAIALGGEISGGGAMAACGAGALAGFLIWNYPRGLLFAGDSGALFAGALAGITSILLIRKIGLSPFIPPVIFFPLLADVLLTLAWRAARRRSLLDGHAEHIYQIAIRAGWSHARISLCYWLAMAVCGAIGYVAAQHQDTPAPWLALTGLAAASLVISYLVRREAMKRAIAETP